MRYTTAIITPATPVNSAVPTSRSAEVTAATRPTNAPSTTAADSTMASPPAPGPRTAVAMVTAT
jgi:hypothetical protein